MFLAALEKNVASTLFFECRVKPFKTLAFKVYGKRNFWKGSGKNQRSAHSGKAKKNISPLLSFSTLYRWRGILGKKSCFKKVFRKTAIQVSAWSPIFWTCSKKIDSTFLALVEFKDFALPCQKTLGPFLLVERNLVRRRRPLKAGKAIPWLVLIGS